MRQNVRYLQQSDIDYVLILSGDQLYRMNYADMLATHLASEADVTIAAMPVDREAASAFGHHAAATMPAAWPAFWKSRKTAEEMDMVRMDPAWIDARGIASRGRDCWPAWAFICSIAQRWSIC